MNEVSHQVFELDALSFPSCMWERWKKFPIFLLTRAMEFPIMPLEDNVKTINFRPMVDLKEGKVHYFQHLLVPVLQIECEPCVWVRVSDEGWEEAADTSSVCKVWSDTQAQVWDSHSHPPRDEDEWTQSLYFMCVSHSPGGLILELFWTGGEIKVQLSRGF